MRRIIFLLGFLMILIIPILLLSETISWDRERAGAVGELGDRKGVIVNIPSGETLPISGEISLTDAVEPDSGVYVKPATGAIFWPPIQEVSGSLSVDNFPATQPISHQALTDAIGVDSGIYIRPAMGAGLATSANQETIKEYLYKLSEAVNTDTEVVVENIATMKDYLYKLSEAVNTDTQLVVNVANTSITVDNVNLDTELSVISAQLESVIITLESLEDMVTDYVFTDTMVELVLVDTGLVYSYMLPAKCVMYEYQSKSYGDLKFSKSEGGIATNYRSYLGPYNTPDRFGAIYTGTLYFKDETKAGTIVEITVWQKP